MSTSVSKTRNHHYHHHLLCEQYWIGHSALRFCVPILSELWIEKRKQTEHKKKKTKNTKKNSKPYFMVNRYIVIVAQNKFQYNLFARIMFIISVLFHICFFCVFVLSFFVTSPLCSAHTQFIWFALNLNWVGHRILERIHNLCFSIENERDEEKKKKFQQQNK